MSKATIGAFTVGAIVLLLAEATILRVAGALALLAAIVCGMFLIANPDDLRRDDR